MNTQDMIAALEQMLAALKGANPQAEPAAPAYPREEVIDGARFKLKAPVNALWRPSQYARIFGRNATLGDPSNAPEGHVLRSPAGFPLVYLLVGPVGAEVPVGEPRVGYADNTFSSDDSVMDYIRRITPSQEDIDRANAQWAEYDESLRRRAAQRDQVPAGETEIKVEQG
jgi:hypothetical protein